MSRRSKDPWSKCLYKHFIRHRWLEFSQARHEKLNKERPAKSPKRGVRYFTFCGQGAKDVYLLGKNGIFRGNSTRQRRVQEFDGVFFFEFDSDTTTDIQDRLPGSIGFPATFEDIILSYNPDDINFLSPNHDPLQIPSDKPNSTAVQQEQRINLIRKTFFESFPFDVINLDLCGHIFKNRQTVPGKILASMRKIYELQKREMIIETHNYGHLSGFTLMFTTEVGPTDLNNSYLDELETCLAQNLNASDVLRQVFDTRTTGKTVHILRGEDFNTFFKLAIPKIIASELKNSDWYVDPNPGVEVYEFDRPATDNKPEYKMLHLVMNVKRQIPNVNDRIAPLIDVDQAYIQTVKKIFESDANMLMQTVTPELKTMLQADLDELIQYAASYGTEEHIETGE